ncbi:MAG TPA: response regulator, partial [Acidimicrobiia bacterium]|nr:response regulator [Acidimicrobiia bacterium]
PIIFVTARAQSSDVEKGMELGVEDYVTKPFDPLDLIARVNTLLERTGEPDSNGEVPPPAVGPAAGVPIDEEPPSPALP